MKSTMLVTLFSAVLFLSSCTDECKYEDCSYHGVCISGHCDCEVGYFGDRCQHIIKPSQVMIERVDILEFPTYKHGESWDEVGGHPDIYFAINRDSEEVYISQDVHRDVPYGSTICDKNLTIALTAPNEAYTLKIYDKDEESKMDQYMSQFDFLPFALDRGLSPTIQIEENGFLIELHVSYVY